MELKWAGLEYVPQQILRTEKIRIKLQLENCGADGVVLKASSYGSEFYIIVIRPECLEPARGVRLKGLQVNDHGEVIDGFGFDKETVEYEFDEAEEPVRLNNRIFLMLDRETTGTMEQVNVRALDVNGNPYESGRLVGMRTNGTISYWASINVPGITVDSSGLARGMMLRK